MSEELKGPEKRQAPRAYKNIPVDYKFVDDMNQYQLSELKAGLLTNISDGGALLEIDQMNEEWIQGLTAKTYKVALELKLLDNQPPISAIAKVMWFKKVEDLGPINRYNLGLMFIDITDNDCNRIKKFVIDSYLKAWNKSGK